MQQLIQACHRLTLVEVILIIVVLLFLFMLLVPMGGRSREPARRVNCAGNLKSIGLAQLMYSGDYDGYFPQAHANDPRHSNFEPLAQWNYIQDGKVWACPSRAEVLTLASNASYRYIGSGLNDDNRRAREVSLAYDESMNHPKNKWINVLFIDGHVDGATPGSKPWAYND